MANATRVSAATMKTIRKGLERDRQRIRALLNKELGDTQSERGDGGRGDASDLATMIDQQEETMAESDATAEDLEAIEGALLRIDQGTYGICQDCGKPIPEVRLLALHTATRDMDCQLAYERSHSGVKTR